MERSELCSLNTIFSICEDESCSCWLSKYIDELNIDVIKLRTYGNHRLNIKFPSEWEVERVGPTSASLLPVLTNVLVATIN